MNSLSLRMACIAVTLDLMIATAPASASDARLDKALLRIDPEVGLEQVCDIEAMHKIGRAGRFHPDRAKSDSREHPVHFGDAMRASGAAFRSKGRWYEFSFECRGTPDHLRVLALTYKIGDLIPEGRWQEFGLWK